MKNYTQTNKLNVGSGQFPKAGYTNVDSESHLHPDVVHDLNVFPYPFPDNHFQLVEADHVLEHLEDPLGTTREIHRILKDGGSLIVRVPHFSRGFTHADHKRGFDVTFPYYFMPSFKGGYVGVEYKVRRVTLRWFAQPYLKKDLLSPFVFYGMTGIGFVIDTLANISPAFTSRFWCFWVGGFEEITFELHCKKH